MPSGNLWELTEAGKVTLSGISFFLLGVVLSALGVRALWNFLQRDFLRLPRLTLGKAAAIVVLWGLLFVIVLTMISGARELMTPGAWERQGATYRLAGSDKDTSESTIHSDEHLRERREVQLERFWYALVQFADAHDGRFPAKDEIDQIPRERWQLPERMGTRYVYLSGRKRTDSEEFLAFEPEVYADGQLALLVNGRVKLTAPETILRALPRAEDAGE